MLNKSPDINECCNGRISYCTSNEFVDESIYNGPNLDIINRAHCLLRAIEEFSGSAQERGYYAITEQNEPGNNRKLSKLSRAIKEHDHKGALAFLKSNNLDPLKDNSVREELLIAKTMGMVYEFKNAYIGSVNKQDRDSLKGQLFRQIELLSCLDVDEEDCL
ncbi:MAG: hypothetical protein PWQ10_191 [Patescibacteria group bacterium]|nr:hypothetical protein [Patescibacteria group bacterium]